MTSKEFVIWLKGFTEGVHEYNVTPKQWSLLKDTLGEVNDDISSVFTMSNGSTWVYTNNTAQKINNNEGATNNMP
jgi:ligand-binding sensor domain-containing protein